ncbi:MULTISPECIES: hypothetical protein [unclassified Streptomyces]|uniref:hypothetical protein n=1 Tax=unclassified Streptomyces TaxID=2593676 RepID=UPI001EF7BCB7|nr:MULTISPECIES: hypothetical protein [unclassified Streptomyces]
MSTPEEQQQEQQRQQRLYEQQQAQYLDPQAQYGDQQGRYPDPQGQYQDPQGQYQGQQQYPQQQLEQPDPYGTQTWQASTWDTSHQPVQSPLDGVPAQYPDPYAAAPDHWFREEPQAPADPQAGRAQPQGPADGPAWGEAAYAPSYPGSYPGPMDPPQQVRETAAPDHWFREEPQAQAQAQPQAQEWVDPTAYLPPQAAAAAAADPAQAPGPAPAQAPAPEPGTAEEEPAWSPPTLAGNTLRAVDPAQARAEGRSPIIDPGPQAAILTAALGLVIAAAAALGKLALLAPLIALQGLTAAGWFRLNGMWPARQGIALAFAGAVAADVAVLAVDEAYGPGAIIGTLGAWVLLTLVLQLRSQADPDERMYGLMASVASAALAIVCAGYLAAGSAAVSVGAAAVAVAVFARALPLPTVPSVGVSLAAAAGAGIAVGGLTSVGAGGALIGLTAGVCALIGLRVAAYDYPSKFVHMTAGVALPLAAAAPAVYLIGRVVG